MCEEKELPRMVEVRYPHGDWNKKELIADLSHIPNVKNPFVCRMTIAGRENGEVSLWPFMRELPKSPWDFETFINNSSGEFSINELYARYNEYLKEFKEE